MNTRTILKASSNGIFSPNIQLRIGQIRQSGEGQSVAIAECLTLREIDPDIANDLHPTMELRPDEAQQWMDELWQVGIRPSEGQGSAGQMAATQKHLEDMRRLVFDPPKP